MWESSSQRRNHNYTTGYNVLQDLITYPAFIYPSWWVIQEQRGWTCWLDGCHINPREITTADQSRHNNAALFPELIRQLTKEHKLRFHAMLNCYHERPCWWCWMKLSHQTWLLWIVRSKSWLRRYRGATTVENGDFQHLTEWLLYGKVCHVYSQLPTHTVGNS